MQANTIIKPTRYWTTPVQDAGIIQRWLDQNTPGDFKPRVFFASFMNWCIAISNRTRNPTTKWADDTEKAQTEQVVKILHTYPARTDDFVKVMQHYIDVSFGDSNLTKGHTDPMFATDASLIASRNELYFAIFSQAERQAIAEQEGFPMPTQNANAIARRERKKERRQARADAAISAAQAGGGAGVSGAMPFRERGQAVAGGEDGDEDDDDDKEEGGIELPLR